MEIYGTKLGHHQLNMNGVKDSLMELSLAAEEEMSEGGQSLMHPHLL